MRKLACLCALALVLAGCQTTDRIATTSIVTDSPERPTQFIMLGAGQYQGELTAALMQNGFKIRPVPFSGNVTEKVSDSKVVEYRQAGYQYALQVFVVPEPAYGCVFSGAYRVHVTMNVVDIAKNETIGMIRQSGPSGECPPLTPVWDLVGKEFAQAWKVKR